MGSIAGIVLREANGTTYQTQGTSDGISWFVNNLRLVNREQTHLDSFLAGYKLRDGGVVPVGNGLVVVDMKENRILTFQDVTAVGYLDALLVAQDVRDLIEENGGDVAQAENIRAAYQASGEGADEYRCIRFREFLEAGKVPKIQDVKDGTLYDLNTPLEVLQASFADVDRHIRCYLDMSPFEVVRYQARTVEGTKRIKADLKGLGFPINSEDNKVWRRWAAHCAKK